MSAHHDDETSLSAIAVREILEMSTREILRLVVGLGSPNMTELLDNLVTVDRLVLAAHLRSRIVKEASIEVDPAGSIEYAGRDKAKTAVMTKNRLDQESTGKRRTNRWRQEAIENVRKRVQARVGIVRDEA